MTIEITEKTADEGSTFIFNVLFFDEDGAPVMPYEMTWTLSDIEGNIVNNREQVSVSSPQAENIIVLSGDDLSLVYGVDEQRVFTVEGLYDSDIASALPIREQAIFTVNSLVYPSKEY